MRYQWLVFGRDDRLSAESIAWNPASRSSSPGWWRWRSCLGTCPKRDVREKRTKQPVGDAEQDDSRDCRRGGNRGEVKIKKSKRDKHANTSGWKGTKRRKKEERGGKEVVEFVAGTISKRKGRKEEEKAGKLASQSREGSSRGTRTRRRTTTNGGSLSSRGSATGMQCGLCAVVAGLFRRAMCIAGSRRGSGESCYQEITPDTQTRRHSQLAPIETGLKAAEIAEHVKEAVETQEVRLIYRPSMHTYVHRAGRELDCAYVQLLRSPAARRRAWVLHCSLASFMCD